MIDATHHPTLTVHCDECDTEYETLDTDFMAFVDELKRAGWRIFRDGMDWTHLCPDCSTRNQTPKLTGI